MPGFMTYLYIYVKIRENVVAPAAGDGLRACATPGRAKRVVCVPACIHTHLSVCACACARVRACVYVCVRVRACYL